MKAVLIFAALCASVLADGGHVTPLHGFDDLSNGLGQLGFGNILPQVLKYSKNTHPHINKPHAAYPTGNHVNSGYDKHKNPGYANTHDVHANPSYNKPAYSNPGYVAPTYSNQGYNSHPVHVNQGYNSHPVHGNQGYNNQPVHGNQGYNTQPVHVDKHPYTPIQLPSYPLPNFGNKQAGVSYQKQPVYQVTGPKLYQTPTHNHHQAYPGPVYNQHQPSPLVNNHQNYVNHPHKQPSTISLPHFPTQVQKYPQLYHGPGSSRPIYTNQVHGHPPAYPKLVYNSRPIYKNPHNDNPLTDYQNTVYKTPVHNTGYVAPTYNNNGYKTPIYNNGYRGPAHNNNGYTGTPTYHANVPVYHKTVAHPHQAVAHKKFDPNNYSVSFNTAYKPQTFSNFKSSNYKNQYRIKPQVYTIQPAPHQQGYQNAHPQVYQNTNGYHNKPVGYHAIHPSGYQNTHQTSYHPVHGSGYQPYHQSAYPSSNTGYNNAHHVVYPQPTGYPGSQQSG